MYNGVRNYYAILLNPVAAALVVMSEAIDHPNAILDWSTIDALETQMADVDDIMGTIRKVGPYDAVATPRPPRTALAWLRRTSSALVTGSGRCTGPWYPISTWSHR